MRPSLQRHGTVSSSTVIAVPTTRSHATFDRHAGRALVQHDGLVVEQAPAVAHVRVQARGISAPPRVYPGGSQMAAGIQGHHVGRALGAIAPERTPRTRPSRTGTGAERLQIVLVDVPLIGLLH